MFRHLEVTIQGLGRRAEGRGWEVKFLKLGGAALLAQQGLRSLGTGAACHSAASGTGRLLRCCWDLALEVILEPGGSRLAEACSGTLETWQIVVSRCWRNRHFPGGKTSQWRNAARKWSQVGTESKEDRARPGRSQPSGIPPAPVLAEPRRAPVSKAETWLAESQPRGPRAEQTRVDLELRDELAASLTRPLEHRPEESSPVIAEG